MNRSVRALSVMGSSMLALALVTGTVGCASTQVVDRAAYADEAEYTNARAEAAFAAKDYLKARTIWAQLGKDFPYSQYAALSELRIGDAYFAEKAYGAAAEAYRAFARLRPRHEQVPYAEFRVVECYARLMPRDRALSPPTYERDLTDALIAYREGRRFIVRQRNSEYVEQAKTIVQDVANRLAEHELYVARYYERRDNHIGAMRRAAHVTTSFPESTLVPQAYLVQAQNAYRLEEYQIVRDALAQVMSSHGESPEVAKIQALVDTIPADAPPSPIRDASAEE